MLIWFCALHCEAKPVIDYYRLHKQQGISGPDHYLHQDIACIVSGIGEHNMAAAVDWSSGYFDLPQASLINMGIAGHNSLSPGSIISANRVSSEQQPGILTPPSRVLAPFLVKHVHTVTQPQTDFVDDRVYDMEAFAFLQHSLQHYPDSSSQIIKIISDNSNHQATRNKAEISKLIAAHMPAMVDFAHRFQPPLEQ